MSAAMGRKTISIHDYPEHLNPFREDDHKSKFWTLGKRLSRSNSINFTGIKELKNSWALRSFIKKGKRREQPSPVSPVSSPAPQPKHNTPKPVNGEDDSQIVFRRAMMYSSMSRGRGTGPYNSVGGALEQAERYEYRGSVTPLPRSRFQERLRSTSQQEVSSLCETPRMARSEVAGSRLSIESANPFEEPTPPIKAPRRKKKRAPLPPAENIVSMQVIAEPSVVKITEVEEKIENHHVGSDTLHTQVNTEPAVVNITKVDDNNETHGDSDYEEINLNVELKIVEEEDLKGNGEKITVVVDEKNVNNKVDKTSIIDENQNEDHSKGKLAITAKDFENNNITKINPEDDILKSDVLKSVSFSKVDIIKYRRNSSVNEDDIKLRRGNLEDFTMANKRSKSFSSACDPIYATYDISLENSAKDAKNTTKDTNGNEEPQKVICKIIDSSRKRSVETISGSERELKDIDKVRIEFEKEIRKLNEALEDDFSTGAEKSVSEIKKKYDKEKSSPNPIPKPRRSPQLSKAGSPVNGIHH